MWAASVRRHETVRAPYKETALPTIPLADVASVARVALTAPGHQGRTYALTGPEPVTPRRQIEAIVAAPGREVSFASHPSFSRLLPHVSLPTPLPHVSHGNSRSCTTSSRETARVSTT